MSGLGIVASNRTFRRLADAKPDRRRPVFDTLEQAAPPPERNAPSRIRAEPLLQVHAHRLSNNDQPFPLAELIAKTL